METLYLCGACLLLPNAFCKYLEYTSCTHLWFADYGSAHRQFFDKLMKDGEVLFQTHHAEKFMAAILEYQDPVDLLYRMNSTKVWKVARKYKPLFSTHLLACSMQGIKKIACCRSLHRWIKLVAWRIVLSNHPNLILLTLSILWWKIAGADHASCSYPDLGSMHLSFSQQHKCTHLCFIQNCVW